MRRAPLIVLPLLVAACGPALPEPSTDEQPVIYGEDDRFEAFELEAESPVRPLLGAVALLVSEARIGAPEDGRLSLVSKGKSDELCSGEFLAGRDDPGFCTGFLIGPDLLVTAAHCLDDEAKCASTSFVFGYARENSEAIDPPSVPEADVYRCGELLLRRKIDHGWADEDFAFVRLDREVANRPILSVRQARAQVGEELLLAGHPRGAALHLGALQVFDAPDDLPEFRADGESLGGFSGSPVLDPATGEVVGILRGSHTPPTDGHYRTDEVSGCLRESRCVEVVEEAGRSCSGILVGHIGVALQAFETR